jgi:uncharacterized cupin superfamily protein
MGKTIDIASAPSNDGTMYPPPHDAHCHTRRKKKLGDAAGLTQFGVNQLLLPPGAWSSQRHWHSKCDEFIYVISGEVTLVSDAGEEILRAGDCAGFKAGDADGHHLQNRTNADVVILEVGTRDASDNATYSDIDMRHPPHNQPAMYTHKDGTPYAGIERRT